MGSQRSIPGQLQIYFCHGKRSKNYIGICLDKIYGKELVLWDPTLGAGLFGSFSVSFSVASNLTHEYLGILMADLVITCCVYFVDEPIPIIIGDRSSFSKKY